MTKRLLQGRKSLALLAAVALLAGGATGAVAGDAFGEDSGAIAVNTRDGSDVFRLAFRVIHANGDTVDNTNAAVAFASCDACRTVAVSIQVLLVESDPSVYDPANLALAANVDCTLCDTFAAAYQYAVGYGYRIKLSADALRTVADIRQQLQALRNESLSDTELNARLDGIYSRLSAALATGVIGQSAPATKTAAPPGDTATTPADTTTAPTGTTTPTDAAPTDTTTTPSTTSTAPAATTPADTTTGTTPTTPTPTDTTTTTTP